MRSCWIDSHQERIEMSTGDFTLDRLWALLSRYSTDSVVGEFQEHITKMQQVESELLESASKRGMEKEEEENVFDKVQLEIILKRCKEHLPKKEYLELLLEVGTLCADYGDHKRAEELFAAVRGNAKSKPAFTVQAGLASLHSAELSIRQARWAEALERLKESRKDFARARYQRGVAQVENHLGVYYAQQGDIKHARQHFNKALSFFQKAKDLERLSTIIMDIGILSNIAGDWEEAVSSYQRALPEFERAGSVERLAELHHNMGMTMLGKQDYNSAIAQFDESLTYANQFDYKHLRGLAMLGKATAYARMKDYPLAMAFANRALNIFRQVHDELSVADSYKVKAIVQRELKNFDIAELYLLTSIRLNEQYNSGLNLGESYFELGVLHSMRNDAQKAERALKQSATFFRRVGARHELTATQQMMTQLNQ